MKKENFSQTFTVLCYAVSLGLQLVFSTIMTATGTENLGSAYIYLSFLLPQVCYILSFAVFAAVARIPVGRVFNLENVKPLPYAFSVIAGLGLFFVALLPNYFLQIAFETSGSSSTVTLPPMETGGEIFLAALLICVLPAVGEELIFRKTFCEGMKGNNEWVIVLLGGLFFSLTHLNLVQTVHQFVLGCVLCFLYLRTKNITVTMLIHFLNNLLALFLVSWTGKAIDWDSTAVLGIAFGVGATLLAGGIVWAARSSRKEEGGTAKVEPLTIGMLVVLGVLWALTAAYSFIS